MPLPLGQDKPITRYKLLPYSFNEVRGILLLSLCWQYSSPGQICTERSCPFVSMAREVRLILFCLMAGRCAMIIDTNQLLGQTLGNCVLERLIGQGGMGAVYLAQQARPRRTIAVKVLLPELPPKTAGVSAEFLARFRREADAIAALDHVNIMPIYEYGEQGQLAYLVMPHVTGGTLRDRLVTHGALPLNEVIPIIEQAAAALDYAHSHGIVHRDLKPGNMLFHADGRLLLTDFGIAKMMNGTSPLDSTALQTLTTTGMIIGTPEYLSPEQATASPVDRRSDVYSLGIVVFHLLAGQVGRCFREWLVGFAEVQGRSGAFGKRLRFVFRFLQLLSPPGRLGLVAPGVVELYQPLDGVPRPRAPAPGP